MSPIGSESGPSIKPCILARSITQSIPDSTFTQISWAAADEVLDLDDWRVGANPTRITPRFTSNWFNAAYTGQGAGTMPFFATLNVRWAANTTGRRRARILKNGVNFVADQIASASLLGNCPLSASGYVMLGVGDYVVAEVWQDSGAALDLDVNTTFTLEVR